jgi:hypothetical protein
VSIQTKSITKEVYKLSSFEVYDEVDRLEKEFPLLNSIVEQEENIRRRRELLYPK